MTPDIRMTHATALILKTVAAGYAYGFDVMDVTGLPSGTVYPALRRLERTGLLRARWEDSEEAREAGRPRRKLYRLTPEGTEALPAAERRLGEVRALLPDLPGEAPERA